jgi:uncharacterized protein YxeA
MYIKIAVVILVLVSIYAGYSYLTRYDTEAANKIVQETEERNKKLQEQIDNIVKENNTLKASIINSEFDKNNLRQEIENNRISIRNIKETNLVNRNRYVEKISSIATDTTDIYNRCLRMCESAEYIGREFSCATDFCKQFSVNSSTTTAK